MEYYFPPCFPPSKTPHHVSMKTKPSKKHKDISRIDHPAKRTFGYYVRVRHLGKIHSKFFADKKNGGKSKSLKAAIFWRNETEIRLGKPRSDRNVVTVSNKLTGVVGVILNDVLNRYEVSWVKPDGKQSKTSVSISKHGRKTAFEKACKIREEKEAARLAK